MSHDQPSPCRDSLQRVEKAYESDKPRLPARVLAAGRSSDDEEDLVQEVYAGILGGYR